ncbi:uncharacterized protein LOC131941294 isoform X2 [Physella acuta]|uniref:uncharacterized protein LOC131941294 isoform X2 n=1 Tax=Physella acuta TaxID=109671 RepID=UPI0027DDA93C|nr:uncharacterized protein LOC131941294 isoform X2 [Physella acuta]
MKIKSYLSNQVGIQFKIWCPNLNRVRHRLFLLGSLPELGAWNIDAALEAYPTPDIHVWKVEAAVPAMATFEWVWLRTAPNRTAVEWERTAKRNRTVDCFSGTVHTIWGEDDEVFHQTATCLELTTFININDGYTLVLVGSTPTTGLWNLNHAVTAKEFPKKSGYWKVNVSFDSFVNLNFKWTVVKERDHTNIKMQEKVQHSIYGRRGWMRAVAPWMQPTVVVLDTSVMADTFDDSLGRTDLVIKERKKRNKEIAEWTKTSNKMSTLPAKRLSDVLPRSRPSFSQENLRSHPGTPPILGDRPKVATLSRPSSDTNHRPQAGLLDELIQQKEKQVRSRTERFTEQLSKTYTDDVTALKGAGQTQLQFDPLNIDLNNQVPLFDGGCCLLMFVRNQKDEVPRIHYSDSSDASSLSADDPEVSTVRDDSTSTLVVSAGQMTPHQTVSEPGDSEQEKDLLIREIDLVGTRLTSLKEDNLVEASGVPVIEKNIKNIISDPPPTWSMLQEDNIAMTRNPVITTRSKVKTKVTVVPMMNAQRALKHQETMTLFQKMKTKHQYKAVANVADVASSTRGPFVPLRGVSDPNMPSVIGQDDTSKTEGEIQDELSNREMWDSLRKQTSQSEVSREKDGE